MNAKVPGTILDDFQWINKSELKGDINNFSIKSSPNSDFFCNPIDGKIASSAPFLFTEIKGNFRISVRVKPVFKSTYDACSIFVYSDETHWLKTAFEFTDLGAPSIVTVATNVFSDDANGVDIKEDSVYLQVIRKGFVFACHYSVDGINYKMARILRLTLPETVKVGVSAQSPTGSGNFMEFSNLKITQTIPEDIRNSK